MAALLTRLRPLEDIETRPAPAKRGHTRSVIGVSMRDQDASKRPIAERLGNGVEMVRRTDAGIDERGQRAVDQPRVVAPPGEGARVPGVQEDGGGRHQRYRSRISTKSRSWNRPRVSSLVPRNAAADPSTVTSSRTFHTKSARRNPAPSPGLTTPKPRTK